MGQLGQAEQRARTRWSGADKRRALPEPCGFCRRSFKTERGAKQHRRRCFRNPAAEYYVSGEYDPIVNDEGAPVGFIWNGRSEQERRRIRATLSGVRTAVGLAPARFGQSHRKAEIGPDPTEPCSRCPEVRCAHGEQGGACQYPGCACREFVGVTHK